MVDSPYKSSVFYRIPPSMFVGVGGSVGGKAPGMGGYIDARFPIYIVDIVATHLVEHVLETSVVTPLVADPPFHY